MEASEAELQSIEETERKEVERLQRRQELRESTGTLLDGTETLEKCADSGGAASSSGRAQERPLAPAAALARASRS
eukprot:6724665-Pyramimonas_sp.AAC.1